MNFMLNMEALAGRDYKDLIKEAYQISQHINVNVTFTFNGAEVSVFHNGNVLVSDRGAFSDFTINTIPDHFPYKSMGGENDAQ